MLFSSVFVITERRDMGLYEVPLSMSWLGFGMGTMLANFHMCDIMLVLRVVFNMLGKNASPRGPMCFRCLMIHLSGPCELLFLLYFIASWTRVVVLYICILCIALLVYLFVLCVACLTVFVNCFYLYFMYCFVSVSVCLVCCVCDSVCELFCETIRTMFGCGLLFCC